MTGWFPSDTGMDSDVEDALLIDFISHNGITFLITIFVRAL
jgi:hypothetical protein